MSRRLRICGLACALLLAWTAAHADAPTAGHPAHQQVRLLLPTLIDSEAEHASGTYIPGIGAVFTLDIIRGPNTIPAKDPAVGTRDWTIYLMQTFGPQLPAVPPEELIVFSVDFYDYVTVRYRQVVVMTRAATVNDPARYTVLLDAAPFPEQPGEQPQASPADAPQPQLTPLPALTAAPNQPTLLPGSPVAAAPTLPPHGPTATVARPGISASPVSAAPTLPPRGLAVTVAPTGKPTAGPLHIALDFADPARALASWQVVGGAWAAADGSLVQTELGKYDLIAFLRQPTPAAYRVQANLTLIAGDMGGGIVFNAPAAESKRGAQMVSYTAKGSFIQWGRYDDAGVFQYEGGAQVPQALAGEQHTLQIVVRGTSYQVLLDGGVIGTELPLTPHAGAFVGLMASTSHVTFDNLILESVE